MKTIVNKVSIALLLAAAITASAQDEIDTPEHVVGDAIYPFDTVDLREEKPEPIELPDSAAEKLALLTEDEIKFLESSDARSFAGPLKGTLEALEERTPEEVKAWVNAMQEVVSQMRYKEGRDLPNIPFNTDSDRLHLVATTAVADHKPLAATRWH